MNQINPYRHGGEALAFDGFGNRSRSFDGVDDEVIIPDNADLPTGAQTWSCWVKLNTVPNTAQDLMLHWAGSISQASFALIKAQSTNKFTAYISSNGSTAAAISESVTVPVANTWYHVAAVYDPSSSLKIYVNGTLENTVTASIPASLHDSTTPLTFGNRSDQSFVLDGNLADCRIYDLALSGTDISDIYNGTNITTNLVGHWLTDADNLLDAVGTNHGTNYGTKYSYDNPSPPVEFGSASRSFNGTSDRVTIPANVFNGATALTISAWIKLDSLGINQTVIGRLDDNDGFRLMVRDTNKIDLIWGDGSSSFVSTQDAAVLTSGSWIHVAGTFNNSGNATRYVDGAQTGTIDDLSSYGSLSILGDVGIGARVQTTSPLYNLPLDGKIADVRIYDAELTASQISDLYSGTDVQANLVGHWLTDNDDVEDKAGTNDGTNFGSTYSYDNPPMDLIPSRQASRSFDGSSDYVDCGDVLDNVFAGTGKKFTIASWVKTNVLENTDFLSKYLGTGNQRSFLCRVLSDGNLAVVMSGDGEFGSNRWGRQTDTAPISANTWHHVAVTYDQTATGDYLRMWVDGVEDATLVDWLSNGTFTSIYDGTADLQISGIQNGINELWGGNIADVRLYDTDLTASQILAIYNGTTDRTNLIGQWLTNSDDVIDHAGTNDGTNNGSTYSNDSPS